MVIPSTTQTLALVELELPAPSRETLLGLLISLTPTCAVIRFPSSVAPSPTALVTGLGMALVPQTTQAPARETLGALALSTRAHADGFEWLDLTFEREDSRNPIASPPRPLLLAIDDESDNLELLQMILEHRFDVLAARSGQEALAILGDVDVAVIVTDYRMPEMTGLEFLRHAAESPERDARAVMLTAFPDVSLLESLVNGGLLYRFLRKPCPPDLLESVCLDAARASLSATLMRQTTRKLAVQCDRLRDETTVRAEPGRVRSAMVGESPALLALHDRLALLARSDITVHFHGETGTGKELAARALHDLSPRSGRRFTAVNCGVLPETLVASILFGHRKGAFTGADRDQPGLFLEADRGTIFLDEVAELSPIAQMSLLRVLQERELLPVGSSRAIPIDVRVVSATSRSLEQAVRDGRFREDLFYRLVVVQLDLPPLRDRREDILTLARHFLACHADRLGRVRPELTVEVQRALEQYAWPGNIRELDNTMQRALALSRDGERITSALLPTRLLGPTPHAAVELGKLCYDEEILAMQRALVGKALDSAGGVVSHAAELLGMDRTRLSKLARRLGLLN